jgi:outer membrane biogenesis lipoprotein LolB
MIQKEWIQIINQLFEIDKKTANKSEMTSVYRNVERVYSILEGMDITVMNPLGQTYSDTRTDCDATILEGGKMQIVEVLKPIIYYNDGSSKYLIQKGVVIVK